MVSKKWVTAGEAIQILGYKNTATIHKLYLKDKENIEVQPHPRNKSHNLYNLSQLKAAQEKRSFRHMNKTNEQWLWLEFKNFLKIKAPAIVIADTHCPLIDVSFFEEALKVRDKYKINRLVLAGDTLDCSALSKFSDIFPIPWADEKRVGRQFIERCCKEFDDVYMLTANHEMRYLRMLGPKVSVDKDVMIGDRGKELDVWSVMLAEWLDNQLQKRLHISIYPYCEVGETWRVTHPDKAWKNPTGLARSLEQIHGKSIMMGHTHMSAWCMAPNAERILIDLGCMANPLQFSWVQLKEQMRYKWTESFGIIREDEWGTLFMKDRGEVPRR